MRHLLAVSLFVSLASTSAASAPAPKESWGKPGITLAQYQQDSVECGLKGYYTDISKTDDAKAFVTASKQLDSVTTGASAPSIVESNGGAPTRTDAIDQMVQYANRQQHIVDSVRVDERFHNIKRTLLSKTDQCLVSRGYSKFKLTDEQRHHLTHLKFGSEQRRQYLYSLASNPAVLQSQADLLRP
jgi:hypothetical protein